MTERSLAAWLAYLEQLHPSAIDMGLDRVRQVAARLGLGRPAKRVVTVTGTNGKGSTCAFLASLLHAQGLQVGVYSSPHLLRYNERVEVDGRLASDAELCAAFTAVEAARGDVSLTYFEMGTLAAFWLFEREQLDVAVLEVGLGGRLDAVNLVDTDLAIITSIGLDHAEWLGETRESVAIEKAGILRPGRPGVCGDVSPPAILAQRVAEIGAVPWLLAGKDFMLEQGVDGWIWRGVSFQGEPVCLSELPLLDLPIENAAVALQAFHLLVDKPTPDMVGPALRAARMTGRLDRRKLQLADHEAHLLLDVGHNPHAAAYLARRLAASPPLGRRLAVFGLLGDKDLPGVIDPLLPLFDEWLVTTLDSPRARPASELASVLEHRGAAVSVFASVTEAVEEACRQVATEDEIVVFGSFFCVAECLEWLGRHAGETADGVVR